MDIHLIGQFYEKQVLLTKYDFLFSANDIDKNVKRLTNQLWKLIPMRENNEDWLKQLDTVIIEVAGLSNIFEGSAFLQLLAKLEGLRTVDINFDLYRKTVFECISLLRSIK